MDSCVKFKLGNTCSQIVHFWCHSLLKSVDNTSLLWRNFTPFPVILFSSWTYALVYSQKFTFSLDVSFGRGVWKRVLHDKRRVLPTAKVETTGTQERSLAILEANRICVYILCAAKKKIGLCGLFPAAQRSRAWLLLICHSFVDVIQE